MHTRRQWSLLPHFERKQLNQPPTDAKPALGSAHGVRYMDIDNVDQQGQRIDNFLIRELGGVPRTRVYRMLRRGEVRVNGRRIKPVYRLCLGDRVRVPPVVQREAVPVKLDAGFAAALERAVLFEDDALLILNKPAGLAVHGGSGLAGGAVEYLRHIRNSRFLELAHRLDRDTSGCLMLAKSRAALTQLHDALRERRVKKRYDVIVAGRWPRKLTTVQLRLLRYVTASGERRVRPDAAGKPCRTDFQVLEQHASATRLQVALHTGRTHQIRVHCKASGHAVLGDTKYGDVAAPRLCLHARRLVVPFGGTNLRFDAGEDPLLQDIWRKLVAGTAQN